MEISKKRNKKADFFCPCIKTTGNTLGYSDTPFFGGGVVDEMFSGKLMLAMSVFIPSRQAEIGLCFFSLDMLS